MGTAERGARLEPASQQGTVEGAGLLCCAARRGRCCALKVHEVAPACIPRHGPFPGVSCWPRRSARTLRAAGARAPETAQAESPQTPGRLACSHVLCGLAACQAHEHGCHRDVAGRCTHAPRSHCRPAVLAAQRRARFARPPSKLPGVETRTQRSGAPVPRHSHPHLRATPCHAPRRRTLLPGGWHSQGGQGRNFLPKEGAASAVPAALLASTITQSTSGTNPCPWETSSDGRALA